MRSVEIAYTPLRKLKVDADSDNGWQSSIAARVMRFVQPRSRVVSSHLRNSDELTIAAARQSALSRSSPTSSTDRQCIDATNASTSGSSSSRLTASTWTVHVHIRSTVPRRGCYRSGATVTLIPAANPRHCGPVGGLLHDARDAGTSPATHRKEASRETGTAPSVIARASLLQPQRLHRVNPQGSARGQIRCE